MVFTIQAGVVIIDWFDDATEVKLHVPLNQSGVKGTKVTMLVVNTAGGID